MESIDITPLDVQADRIYVSKLSRSVDTAKCLFPNRQYYELREIGEVPLRSFMDTKKRLPLLMWNVLGRVQWYICSNRQIEKRSDTIIRANKVLDLCEGEKSDCVLITHGFFIKTLITAMKKRGYVLSGDNQIGIKNLQMILAKK